MARWPKGCGSTATRAKARVRTTEKIGFTTMSTGFIRCRVCGAEIPLIKAWAHGTSEDPHLAIHPEPDGRPMR